MEWAGACCHQRPGEAGHSASSSASVAALLAPLRRGRARARAHNGARTERVFACVGLGWSDGGR
eukprot:scaffold2799_cov408-Prasinococcus_capsulatus_cf.AAC.5